MASKVNLRQLDALRQILYTGAIAGVHPSTFRALVNRGLVHKYTHDLTLEGIRTVNPDFEPVQPSPEVEEARRVQNELIAVIEKRGWSLNMRLSKDMPEDITGLSLLQVVYPEWISEFRRMIIQFQR